MRSSSRRQAIFSRIAVGCVLAIACAAALSQAQPEGKRITFHTTQTSYSLAVSDRNNTEYVGILEALEPMGAVSAKTDSNKWKLKFREVDAQFENGKNKAKIQGKSVELPAGFVLENGRGLVPLHSLKDLLPIFTATPVNVHESARRVFIGVPATHVSLKRSEAGTISFTFSAPVNPFIATEPGKLRMVFTRDPLQADWRTQSFDDSIVSNATYAEANGAAELTVNSNAPLIATFSEDRKIITVAGVAPAPATPQVTAQAQPASPSQAPQAPAAPPVRVRPAIILDAAHGGSDPGAALSDKIVEKDVTLAFARQLKRELEVRGIVCTMLRDSDTTLPVADRAALVNASKSVLYVAIHASTVSSGVRTFTAPLSPQAVKTLQFLPVNAAQAPYVQTSRTVASAISTELLKRDMPVVSVPGDIAPLSNIHIAAIAIEIAPPPQGSAADLVSAAYQRQTALALANALAAAEPRQADR